MSETASRRRWLAPVLVMLALVGLLLVLEGVLSLGAMMAAISNESRPLPSAHRFMSHDEVLGWTAPPGLAANGAYGEWRPLTTNESGLRAPETVSQEPPEDQFRILCAGGSGVFGVNVADQETWCSRLGGANTSVETINAGQPGFGPDQSWLLLRDRIDFRHDLLLFAIDGRDMYRLVANDHAGFPKPRLEPGESELKVVNTPIPGRPFLWPWMTFNAPLFSQSHLLAPLIHTPSPAETDELDLAASVVMTSLATTMKQWVESNGSRLAVVYLPTHPAYGNRADQWRERLASSLSIRGIPFLDLDGGQSLQKPGSSGLFDREVQLTPKAHQWIVAALKDELEALESVDVPPLDRGPWRVRYFRDAVFQDFTGVENHAVSGLYWGEESPLPEMPADGFSVILDSCLPLEESRRIRVRLEADGHATFAVNGQTVLDTGEGEGALFRVNAVDLPPGTNRLRVRYRDSAGDAAVRLLFRFEDGTVVTPGLPMLEAPGSDGC